MSTDWNVGRSPGGDGGGGKSLQNRVETSIRFHFPSNDAVSDLNDLNHVDDSFDDDGDDYSDVADGNP
jgi:hypothetical protein